MASTTKRWKTFCVNLHSYLVNEEEELQCAANFADYDVIPRPHDLLQSLTQKSFSVKDKKPKELSVWEESISKKPYRKSLEKVRKVKENYKVPKVKSRIKSSDIAKAPKKERDDLDKKFQTFLKAVKKDGSKYRSKPESKSTANSGKSTSHPASMGEKFASKDLEFLKKMEVTSVTAQDKYEVLEARDSFIRLQESKRTSEKAKKVMGTCPDMCPEKERYSRIAKNCLSLFEMKMAIDTESTSKEVDHRYMVKEYSRSSADQQEPLPHELRPVTLLKTTMDYLVCNVLDYSGESIAVAEWYDFIWNRTRSMRKDITQQQLCDVDSVDIVEKCARFHILCAELLSEEDTATFDPRINNENLTKCLQTLKHMYHDLQTRGVQCPNEAEFRAYDVLLSLTEGEVLRLVKDVRPEIFKSPQVRCAFQAALAFNSNNYVKFFKLMESASYLSSCIMHRFVNDVRSRAMQVIVRAYSLPQNPTMYPISVLVDDLKFEDEQDAVNFCVWYGLTINESNVVLQRQSTHKPETACPITRSFLISQKLKTGFGEIVNNGPLPENPLQWYKPQCSFDEFGLLQDKGYDYQKQEVFDEEPDPKSICEFAEDIEITEHFSPPSHEEEEEEEEEELIFPEVPAPNEDLPPEAAPEVDFPHPILQETKEDPFESFFSLSQQEIPYDPISEATKPAHSPFLMATLVPHIRTERPESSAATAPSSLFSFKEKIMSPVPKTFTLAGTVSSFFGGDALSKPSFGFFSNAVASSGSSFFKLPSTSKEPTVLSSRLPTPDVTMSSPTLKSPKLLEIPEINLTPKSLEIYSQIPTFFQDNSCDRDKLSPVIEIVSDLSRETKPALDDVDKHDSLLSLENENVETLQRMREDKIAELAADITDEVCDQCVEDLAKDICGRTLLEELVRDKEHKSNRTRLINYLAKRVLFKWRLFCERKKQRRNFIQDSQPFSPWIPMLVNTQYVTSGATSPFSVYKKRCSLNRLEETKLKEMQMKAGWEPFTGCDWEIFTKQYSMPSAYLKGTGMNQFLKIAIVLMSVPDDTEVIRFMKWLCKKFKLTPFDDTNPTESNLSFYSLNGGKTVLCFKSVTLDFEVSSFQNILDGISAAILFCPNRFPNSTSFQAMINQFTRLMQTQNTLAAIPLCTLLVHSQQKYNSVEQLESHLNTDIHLKKIFHVLDVKHLSSLENYKSNSAEISNAIKWIMENQDMLPNLQYCSIQSFLEDSFASIFDTVFWKLSLEEFKPLNENPDYIIKFYNNVLKSRASALTSQFLVTIARSWPLKELRYLKPECKSIDMVFQRKVAELVEGLVLPKFSGEPDSSDDIKIYVREVADSDSSEMLFISIEQLLSKSLASRDDIDWANIVSKCALHQINSSLGKTKLLGDIFYLKEDFDSMQFEDYWRKTLSFIQPIQESDAQFMLNESMENINKIWLSPLFEPVKNELVQQSFVKKRKKGTSMFTPEMKKKNLEFFNELQFSRIPIVGARDYPESDSECDSVVPDDGTVCAGGVGTDSHVDNMLAALRNSLKKQKAEADEFTVKLNQSLTGFKDKRASRLSDFSSLVDDINLSTSLCSSEVEPVYFDESSSVKVATDCSDIWKRVLGKDKPVVSSPCNISEKLSELRYNIERNNIIENNLSLLLDL